MSYSGITDDERLARVLSRCSADGNGCQIYGGYVNPQTGYGQLNRMGTVWTVHRFVVFMTHGPIPPGLYVDHTCMTKACCNADHLRLVTPRINVIENTTRYFGNACPKCGGERIPRSTRSRRLKCPACIAAVRSTRIPVPRRRPVLATHCGRGHEMIEPNVWVNPRTGARRCRACHAVRERSRLQRLKVAA